MSFLRVRHLKNSLYLYRSCVKLIGIETRPRPSYTFLQNNVGSGFFARSCSSQTDFLEKKLNILSEYAVTRKRIDERDIRDVIRILETEVQLSYNDITMLLRCCGRFMVRTHPSVRTNLLNKMWELIERSGLRLSAAQYNAKLLAMLENEQQFLVHEELAAMDALGIQANRATYQIMIDKLLRDGDLFVANEIKKHMEELGIPVTNMVYNAFIRAHIEKGNFEEAEKVKDILVDAGYEVDARAYTAMIEAHGTRGELDSIKELLKEAAQRGVKLDVNELKEGVSSLCKNGHDDKAKELIALMPVDGEFNQSLMNCMHEAVVLGYSDVAIEAYRKVDPAFPSRSADSILVSQIAQGMPVDKVLETLTELRTIGRTDADLEELTKMAMNVGSADQMMEYIEKMHEQGKPIWTHFFRPPLLRYGREQNIDGLFHTLKRMVDLSGDADQALYYVTSDGYPILKNLEFSDVVDRLKGVGFSGDDLNRLEIYSLLVNGNYKEALDFHQRVNLTLQRPLISSWIRDHLANCGDYIGAIKFLSQHYRIPPRDLYSKILFTMIRDPNLPTATLSEALQLYLDKALSIERSEETFAILKKEFKWQGIPDDVIEKVRLLQYDLTSRVARSLPNLGQFNELERTRQRKIRLYDEQFLEELCTYDRREEAVKLKERLESRGYQLTPNVLYALGTMEVRLNNLDEAMKYKNFLDTQGDDFDYSKLVVRIANLLIKYDRIDEGLHMLEQYSENHRIRLDREIKMHVTSIIKECGRKHSFAIAKNVVDVLLKGYVDQKTPEAVSRPLITAYINKNDAKGIVEALEYCRVKFDRLPPFRDAMVEFVKQGDGENLQRVVDLVASYRDESAALHYLIITLVNCDKLAEARKLAQTPGLRGDIKLLQEYCTQLYRDSMMKVLQNLFDVTKGMKGLNRDEMLFQMIKAQCLHNKMKQAVGVLDLYKEVGVQPSGRTLRYLGKALKNAGLPVPFDIPQIPLETHRLEVAKPMDTPESKLTVHRKKGNASNSSKAAETVR